MIWLRAMSSMLSQGLQCRAFAFSPTFRSRLNALAQELLRGGGVGGEAGRKGRLPGNVEFRDHRAYAPGDDLRFLDWNVFLRSGALAVKTFTHEEAPEAVIVLDRSASMGPPGSRQDVLAREIAAALGFLALRAGGEVILRCAGGHPQAPPPPLRGPRALDPWIAAVEAAPEPSGPGGLDHLERVAAPSSPGRVVAWISDFLVDPLPAAAFAALARSASRRLLFVVCAHDDALAGVRAGDAALLGDCEGQSRVTARHDERWRAAFQEARAEHVAAVTALAARHHFAAVAASAETPFDECVRRALRGDQG
jgi:uncharacterized protein (DUF58 family)